MMISILRKREVRSQAILLGSLLLLFSLLFGFLLRKAINLELSHDEHQFIASGELLANDLDLPYEDYPHQHTPNLVFLYALIFKITEFSLLGARAFSVLCATLSAGVIFCLVYRRFHTYSCRIRCLLGVASVVLLVTNPLFEYTSGRAWNHDLPTLLTLLSFSFLPFDVRARRPGMSVFISGLMLGLAVGTRLSYATALVPVLGSFLIVPADQSRSSGRKDLLMFCFGFGLALLPTILLFLNAPKGFIYGNFVYPRLNTVYRNLQRHSLGMTIGGKIVYFAGLVIRVFPNYLLLMAFLIVGLGFSAKSIRAGKVLDPEAVVAFAISLFLLLGSFVPTPSWLQYFYAPVPFAILGIYLGSATLSEKGRYASVFLTILVLLSLVSTIGSIVRIDDRAVMTPLKASYAAKVHNLGMQIKSLVGEGKVLTLAPILPLEGGLDIYEAFVTGPFTWRTVGLLTEEKRREYRVVSDLDLEEYLRSDPPAALLLGFEAGEKGLEFGEQGGLEEPLEAYALRHGYRAISLPTDIIEDEVTLWVR